MPDDVIAHIVVSHRCTGCGICTTACRQHCLELQENSYGELNPVWKRKNSCNHCGVCLKVCPAEYMRKADNPLLQSGSISAFMEKYKQNQCFAIHSLNQQHRNECASGGFTSEFLSFLLSNRLVDFCIIIVRENANALKSVPIAINDPEQIFLGRGSKYSPVDYSQVPRLLTEAAQNGQKVALVGLPCQLAGISAYATLHPEIKKSILCTISLVCGHTPTFRAYDYLFKKIGSNRADLKKLSNRGDGWPGYMTMEFGTSPKRVFRHAYGGPLSWGRLFSSPFCMTRGCVFCTDPVGFTADISVSDAWLPRFRYSNNPGENLVWFHNSSYLNQLDCMIEQGILHKERVTFQDFVSANRTVFEEKSYCVAVLNKILSKSTNNSIGYSSYYLQLSILSRFQLRIYYWHLMIYWHIFRFIPLSALFLFYGKCLSLLKKKIKYHA